jgi:hypothetical protein
MTHSLHHKQKNITHWKINQPGLEHSTSQGQHILLDDTSILTNIITRAAEMENSTPTT